MRSGGNNFGNFCENQLTKLAHLKQHKRMLITFLKDLREGYEPFTPLSLPWLRHWRAVDFVTVYCRYV